MLKCPNCGNTDLRRFRFCVSSQDRLEVLCEACLVGFSNDTLSEAFEAGVRRGVAKARTEMVRSLDALDLFFV